MRHTEPGDEELALIQRVAHGDHEAFRSLVTSYEPKLLAYLTQMLSNAENARDIAQDTFVTIFHSLPRWTPPARETLLDPAHPLAPWLYRIATNQALSLLRKQAVRTRVHDSMVSQATHGQATHGQTTFEERYVARELLREALYQLSDEDAACLVLHFVSGERYAEIAARLGLSTEAVRKRVTRGLIALRKAYLALDMEVRS